MKIGIVGYGVVGRAVAHSYSSRRDVSIFDTDGNKRQASENEGFTSIEHIDQLHGFDSVFVCVPTPAASSGAACTVRLGMIVSSLADSVKAIICKSTAPVSCYKEMPLNVVYSPEFLRQETALRDYEHQTKVIIGIEGLDTRDTVDLRAVVHETFNYSTLKAPLVYIPRDAAVIAKYAHNVSLAAKVAVMNEMYDLATAQEVEWNDVMIALQDTNAGHSHTQVPGTDGLRGFGGACFPKDLKAILKECEDLGIDTRVLRATKTWSR